MVSDLEAIKKIILQNYKAYRKPIGVLEVMKLLAQVKEKAAPYDDVISMLARLSTFALSANFFRGETPRDVAVCRESSRIAFAKAV